MSIMPISDIIPESLKSEIIYDLIKLKQDLEIISNYWQGESKNAYDKVKESAEREINTISSIVGGL